MDNRQCTSDDTRARRGMDCEVPWSMDIEQCASENVGNPWGHGHQAMCQQGRWALKGVDCEVPWGMDIEQCANKNAEVDCEISYPLLRGSPKGKA